MFEVRERPNLVTDGTGPAFEKSAAVGLNAPAVIFVHGAMSRGRHFRLTTELLPEFTTIAYDRRGYAGSRDAGTGRETYEDHASDLVDLIEAHANGGATVIAHSHGGGIALLAAIREPDLVHSIGLWEPLLGWLPWWDPYPREAAARVAAMSDPVEIAKDNVYHAGLTWEGISETARATLVDQSLAYQADMRASLQAPFELGDVGRPVLIGIGTHGMTQACGPAPRLAAELGARCVEYDAGHDVQRATPEVLAQFVRRAVGLAARP